MKKMQISVSEVVDGPGVQWTLVGETQDMNGKFVVDLKRCGDAASLVEAVRTAVNVYRINSKEENNVG